MMIDSKVKVMLDTIAIASEHEEHNPVGGLSQSLMDTQKVNLLMQEHLDIVTGTTEEAAQTIIERVISVDTIITELTDQLGQAMQECETVKREGLTAIADLQSSLNEMVSFVEQRKVDAIEHKKNICEILNETKKLSGLTNDMNRMSIQGTCLAVNAASQAVQAGEQGRGFKVVADEVRNMSSLFKKMATSIDTSIEQVVCKVAGDDATILDQKAIDSDVKRLASFTSQLESIIGLFQRYNDMSSQAFGTISHSSEQAGESIMEMMASIQFQDITRQQIGTVKASLGYINNHFDNVIGAIDDPVLLASLAPLNTEGISNAYVMDNQRQAHNKVFEGEVSTQPEEKTLAIELF